MNNKIVIVNIGSVVRCPPVISLIHCLLNNRFEVCLIGEGTNLLPQSILSSNLFQRYEVDVDNKTDLFARLKRRFYRKRTYKSLVNDLCTQGDILWTTNDVAMMFLEREMLNHKHVMQLMELTYDIPLFNGSKFLHYSRNKINKIAQHANVVVVPEINRACLQKIWWKLKKDPIVLPNKPYLITYNKDDPSIKEAEEIIRQETRKIILYLGVFSFDRDLSYYSKAIEEMNEEYVLYLVGSVSYYGGYKKNKDLFDRFLYSNPRVKYLGYFPAPLHLTFLKYAFIGLLPYYVNQDYSYVSQINALYCAPNKIFEYAGFGVPMIGSDVLGLKYPFEKYNIGLCCNDRNKDDIKEKINRINDSYESMKKNCEIFFNSVDIDYIIGEIITECNCDEGTLLSSTD